MNFHEYQAKQLFADYGIAVPAGKVARNPDEAVAAAKAIPGDLWVVKAQIHAGGRGKAGGVKLARTFDEVKQYAAAMLGTKMATYQSAGVALPVDTVLVTQTIGGGRVVRLALGSGATVGTVGDGILQHPRGIAVAATGEIVVADDGTKLVHVSLFVLVFGGWLGFFWLSVFVLVCVLFGSHCARGW